MTPRFFLTAVIVLLLLLSATVLAQVTAPGRGSGIGGARPAPATPDGGESQAAPTPRPALQVTKITGQVESLSSQPGPGGQVMVQTAVLKTASGSVTIFMGPVWYVNEQKFPLKVGDTWEVTAHQRAMGQRPGLVAREVRTGQNVLRLRNDQGQPLWRGPAR